MKRVFLLISKCLDSCINFVDLNNRQCSRIKQPQASSKPGELYPRINQSTDTTSMESAVFEGMCREPKKKPPLRLPSLVLFCEYPIHPTLSKARENVMPYSPYLLIGTHLLLAAVNLLRYGGLSNAY